jgi:1-acyl-sn-glycerol-3-phosphate acyltransferase
VIKSPRPISSRHAITGERFLLADQLSFPLVRYPLPWKLGFQLAKAVLFRRRRDFGADALRVWKNFPVPVEINGTENLPHNEPYLLTVNHYTRPGFEAWWWAFALTALARQPVHWVITAAWTFPGNFWGGLISPLTWPLFREIARVYRFIPMPPMPPRQHEIARRAQAVRQALSLARRDPAAILGLAPEGRDSPNQSLQPPPPGAGRFIALIAQTGRPVLPAGVHESQGKLVIKIGEAYLLDWDPNLSPEARDQVITETVMTRIGSLLPEQLRGPYPS